MTSVYCTTLFVSFFLSVRETISGQLCATVVIKYFSEMKWCRLNLFYLAFVGYQDSLYTLI